MPMRPDHFAATLVQIVSMYLLYCRSQGRMLQDREQRILAAVTVRAE